MNRLMKALFGITLLGSVATACNFERAYVQPTPKPVITKVVSKERVEVAKEKIEATRVPSPTFTPTSTSTPIREETCEKTYTVKSGDWLSKISQATGITIENLVEWNDIENPNLINVGQKLCLEEPSIERPLVIGSEPTKIPPTKVPERTTQYSNITKLMDEIRKYIKFFEAALEIDHYTNEVLNLDQPSSYACLRKSDDLDKPPVDWNEIPACLNQMESDLSNLIQKITDANLWDFINRDSFTYGSGRVRELYRESLAATNELRRLARFEDAFKYNMLAHQFEGPGGFGGFSKLSDAMERLPYYLIGCQEGDVMSDDVFSNYLGFCWGWTFSGKYSEYTGGDELYKYWIYEKILENERSYLQDYFFMGAELILGSPSFAIFEYKTPEEAGSGLDRLYSFVDVDEIPVVADGRKLPMIYWKVGSVNMYALIARQDEYLLVIHPSTDIKRDNERFTSNIVTSLLTR